MILNEYALGDILSYLPMNRSPESPRWLLFSEICQYLKSKIKRGSLMYTLQFTDICIMVALCFQDRLKLHHMLLLKTK